MSEQEEVLIIPKSLEQDAKEMFPSGYFLGQRIVIQEYIEESTP